MNNWREERERWRDERRKWREERWKNYGEWGIHYRSDRGHVWTGMLLLIIGVLALLKVTAAVIFPVWFFTWPMLLIAIGFFSGIRHNFRGGFWFVMMLIGGAFLVERINPDFTVRQYVWPLILIALGMFFILRPRRRKWYGNEYTSTEKKTDTTNVAGIPDAKSATSDEDYIDSTAIFGGAKKKIFSKNFKGGDITNIFGGAEIDMSQADINGEVRLDLTQIFGGTKIIIPANWKLILKNAAILGGVEDKRPSQPYDPNKILIITGTTIFGGIEIKSY